MKLEIELQELTTENTEEILRTRSFGVDDKAFTAEVRPTGWRAGAEGAEKTTYYYPA